MLNYYRTDKGTELMVLFAIYLNVTPMVSRCAQRSGTRLIGVRSGGRVYGYFQCGGRRKPDAVRKLEWKDQAVERERDSVQKSCSCSLTGCVETEVALLACVQVANQETERARSLKPSPQNLYRT